MKSMRRASWVMLCLGLAAVLSGCGTGESPQQQAETFVANVKPGMTWEQVIAVKAPRRYARADSEAMGGHKQLQDFSEQGVRDGIANKSLDQGFVFHYKFSDSHVYNVWFDETGKVTEVQKVTTMNDLLAP